MKSISNRDASTPQELDEQSLGSIQGGWGVTINGHYYPMIGDPPSDPLGLKAKEKVERFLHPERFPAPRPPRPLPRPIIF